MEIPSELFALCNFLFLTLIHFIPCLLGSAVSQFIKNTPPLNTSKRRSKRKTSTVVLTTFVSAIFPTILITIFHTMFEHEGPEEVYLGIAVILGALGDDITRFFLSFKNTMVLLKTLSKGMHDIKDIASALEELDDYRDHTNDNKNDNNDV